MAVKVMVPTALRRFADNKAEIEITDASTVDAVMEQVTGNHAELKKHLYDDAGNIRSFVNLYVNNEDIRHLQKGGTEVKEGDVIMIVPSIAGGKA